jgi:hypothetical protein
MSYLQLGFRHITDLAAADHILFLVALGAIYRPGDWRELVWVITAFTVGHSVTLALAVLGILPLPTTLIEFLIPVTILATGLGNVVTGDRERARWHRRYRPVFAGIFGLVHGAGFAGYLRAMFVDRVAVPLFGFNVGIELGQIVVLTVLAVSLAAIDRVLERLGARGLFRSSPLRVRVMAVSSLVVLVALGWAVDRRPW